MVQKEAECGLCVARQNARSGSGLPPFLGSTFCIKAKGGKGRLERLIEEVLFLQLLDAETSSA